MVTKTNRERLSAILHYKDFDRVPVMHFGFWNETLEKWEQEGHLTRDEVAPLTSGHGNRSDGNEYELAIARKLGFDDNILVYTGQKGDWYDMPLFPAFEEAPAPTPLPDSQTPPRPASARTSAFPRRPTPGQRQGLLRQRQTIPPRPRRKRCRAAPVPQPAPPRPADASPGGGSG